MIGLARATESAESTTLAISTIFITESKMRFASSRSFMPTHLAVRLESTVLTAIKTLIINSLGGFVTETAEMAVRPMADTILESMIFENVVKSTSRNDGTPIFKISFVTALLSAFIHNIFPLLRVYQIFSCI